jgi:hypothetical protein
LVSIVAVYVPYFYIVWRAPLAYVGLFWLAVIVLVGLLMAFHTANALATKSIRATGDTPPLDELDRLIELRASKLAGMVLAVVVIGWSMAAMFGAPVLGLGQPVEANLAEAAVPLLPALAAVQALFAGFVLANLVYYAGIVVGYRRLAGG